ncbi:MAG: chemotaxis protein CheW [Desulfitobacteriaceae bacterium]
MEQEEQWVVVRVGEGHCGIPVALVKEIVKLKYITPLPHSPRFVEGLMNLRGQIVSVINLGDKLNGVQKGFSACEKLDNRFERVVVIRHLGELVGLHVDEVDQVITIDTQRLERINDGDSQKDGLICGVFQLEDALVLKLDLDILLQTLAGGGVNNK